MIEKKPTKATKATKANLSAPVASVKKTASKTVAKAPAKKAASAQVDAPAKKVAAPKAPVKKVAPAKSSSASAAPAAKPTLRTIQFGCFSPASGIVEVAGDFNGWVPSNNPMTKDANGNWSVKIKLRPGRYTYKFVYDGVAWELDQQAPAMADLDGHLNSVVDVV